MNTVPAVKAWYSFYVTLAPPLTAWRLRIMDEKLRPFERLQLPREFRRVFRKGRRVATPFLRVHYAPTNREYSRLGLVVRRKLGNAVRRNRVKRQLREVFRRHKYRLNGAFDVVLVPQGEPRSYHDYETTFRRFLSTASRSPAGARRSRRP